MYSALVHSLLKSKLIFKRYINIFFFLNLILKILNFFISVTFLEFV